MNPMVLSVFVGVAAAMLAGFNPLAPYLYEVIILGGTVFLASLLYLVFTILRVRVLQGLVLLGLPLIMYGAQGIVTCQIRPTTEWRKDTQPQVSLRTWMDDHGNLRGEITNQHKRDWLYQAEVQCRMVYGNGKPSDTVYSIGMGAGASWLAAGERHSQMLIDGHGNFVAPGMDVSRTQCNVVNAQMYKDPAVKPQFTQRVDPRSHKWLFEVSNNRSQSLRAVKFSCWAARMGRQHKVDLIGRPLYEDSQNYIVKPGESVVLYVDQSADVFDLQGCEIKDVDWL
jgi:hypothetical protein